MRKTKQILFILLLAIGDISYSAQDSSYVRVGYPTIVDSIKITGNDITEPFVILEELTFSIGDTVDQNILDYNKERLYSLRIFTFVDLLFNENNGKNIVNIIVKESWYIYPWIFAHLYHSDFKYATYGFYLRWKNFRGRNESLRITVAFGYDPYYKIDYVNPYLIKDESIYFTLHSTYVHFQNKSKKLKSLYGEDVNYKIFNNSVSLGKRFDKYNYLSTVTGFSYIELEDSTMSGATASGDRIDCYPFVTIGYIYDSRDLAQYPQNGIYAQAAISHSGFGINSINYNSFQVDVRNYWNFYDDFVARARTTIRHTFGQSIPYYAFSYLGYDEIVRGHCKDVREGNNYLLGTIEISYPLLDEWNFSVNLPLIPERITSTRIGLNIYLFADTGLTFMNNQNIKFKNLYSGWGIGINILFLPYSGIKFEYAFNEHRDGELIIGTNYSF